MIRVDHPDALFNTKYQKERVLVEEIRRIHATGQPILIGTATVEESERLSSFLPDVPHRVLNARNHEMEAAIIAQAGQRGAVTVSTNMAGRGTDILLGEEVADLGGLCVIGTNRHESRRIDYQLRGRAGRQGDPGSSRFFVSMEDPLIVKNGDLSPDTRDPETIQRLTEGLHLDQRIFLHGYDVPIEGQRNIIHTRRQEVLEEAGDAPSHEQLVTLRTIDDLWADYLERIDQLRQDVVLQSMAIAAPFMFSLGSKDPHQAFLQKIAEWFPELEQSIPEEIDRRLADAEAGLGPNPAERGAVWTYLTTDQPFGSWTKRVMDGLKRKLNGKNR